LVTKIVSQCELKELRDPLMLQILEHILRSYDDIIAERLSRTDLYPSKARKGLGDMSEKVILNNVFAVAVRFIKGVTVVSPDDFPRSLEH
jgi:hypothetical protein